MKIAGMRFEKSAAVKEWGFTSASLPRSLCGNGCGVLICHGFGGTPDNMSCLFDEAAALGYSAVMPLLSGHASTLGKLNSASADKWRGDVDAAYGELLEMGCEKILLCGLSMGALLMTELAAKKSGSGKVCGAMIVCPPVRMKGYLRFTEFISPIAPYILTAVSFENAGTEIYCGTATRKLRDISKLGKAALSVSDRIDAPVMLVEAGRDNRVDPVSFKLLESRMPNCRRELIPDAPHGIPYSPQKDELCRLFRRFAEECFE